MTCTYLQLWYTSVMPSQTIKTESARLRYETLAEVSTVKRITGRSIADLVDLAWRHFMRSPEVQEWLEAAAKAEHPEPRPLSVRDARPFVLAREALENA